MRHIRTWLVSLGVAHLATGQAYFENFEGGTNAAGWTFGASNEGPTMPGGFPNQGWYLRGTDVVSDSLMVRTGTGVASGFVGDFAARRVSAARAAFKVFSADPPLPILSPFIVVINRNGTPGDPSDDWGAFAAGFAPGAPVNGWVLQRFSLPAYSLTLPGGWTFISFGPNAPANPTWPILMASVDALAFSFTNPAVPQPVRTWTVGADAIWLASIGSSCYANCDESTIVPFLNILDFVCFTNRFSAGDTRANCDSSTTLPVLNVNDFTCFLEAFAAGCGTP